MNAVVTNVDLGSVLIEPSATKFQDEILNIPGDTTVLEGTILARDSTSGELVLFVAGGSTRGNGIPKTVLTYAVTNTANSAAKRAVRTPTAAQVRRQRLVIHGSAAGTGITNAIADQLRDYAIIPTSVDDESILDNQ